MSAAAIAVRVDDDLLTVELEDGRTLGVPLVWFPTLLRAGPAERAAVTIMLGGDGLWWEALDLDLSVAALLDGRRELSSPAPAATAA